ERWLRQDWLLILELMIYTIPVFALLALQQDLGTALVFLAIFAGLVLISGVSWKIILPVVLFIVGGLAGFLFLFLSEGGRAFLHQQL
ncbi:FtsW/RodA/SpoVE family cell cycle protein, partial [Phocaeicola vulgatus]